jgi:hypothetical protein
MKLRFGLESALAAIALVLATLTAVWPAWLELITGLDPDRGNGSLEWIIAAAFALVAIIAAALARHDWIKLKALRTA